MNSPSEHLDQAKDIREGEELPLEELSAWLRTQEAFAGIEGPLELQQFRAGYSNLTYLLKMGEREFVLRRPPRGHNIATGHDMSREFRVLSKLGPAWAKAPSPLVHHDKDDIIGAPFYVMERLKGIILRRQLPRGMSLDQAQAGALSRGLIDTLAELHGLDYNALGLGELGKAEGYVRRQVEGWTRRYRKAQTDEHKEIDELAAWLDKEQPTESGVALIHNDYKYDNVVLDPEDPTRITGVLDWEMCTLGDPLMDLGTTLGYWVQGDDDPRAKFLAFGPTYIPGSLTRQQLVDRYQGMTGRKVERPVFYSAFGIFKIAVIIQQIYARFKAGLTKDPRFEPLGLMVGLLGELAAKQLDADSLG